MNNYQFANILFSGGCNLRCPHCIGQAMKEADLPPNLDRFPLKNLDAFVARLRAEGIGQVSVTGTNAEPQLYPYEASLIRYLRARVPGVRISLHTNGTLILQKPEIFNRYDRAAISLPSFEPETCWKMTGVAQALDLEAILKLARIPVKISTLLTDDNRPEIPRILARCRELGIRRMVLRKLYRETRDWGLFSGMKPVSWFAGNPCYRVQGMEVTVWDFSRTRVRCLNLFSNGAITDQYRIAEQGHARDQAA